MEILSAGRVTAGSQAARVLESAVAVDSVAVDRVVDPGGEMKVTAIRIRSDFMIIDA
jgi:hypothetical protein